MITSRSMTFVVITTKTGKLKKKINIILFYYRDFLRCSWKECKEEFVESFLTEQTIVKIVILYN